MFSTVHASMHQAIRVVGLLWC